MYSLSRLSESLACILATKAIEGAIAKRVERGDIARIETEVIKNIEALNIGASKLDLSRSSNSINTLTKLYFLL